MKEEFTDYLCFRLGAAARKIQRYYNAKLGEYGITIGQSFILLSLLERDGRNVKELAERLLIDSSAITGLVDRLEKEELVERRPDERDRRALRIHLTPKGALLARELEPTADEVNRSLGNGLSPSEMQALDKFFRMVDGIDDGSSAKK